MIASKQNQFDTKLEQTLYCLGTKSPTHVKSRKLVKQTGWAWPSGTLIQLKKTNSMFCKKTHLPYQEDKYYCILDEHKKTTDQKTQCMNPKRSWCAFLLHVRPYSSILYFSRGAQGAEPRNLKTLISVEFLADVDSKSNDTLGIEIDKTNKYNISTIIKTSCNDQVTIYGH